MIYYKGKIGYCTKYPPSSLSDITFTDDNFIFPILQYNGSNVERLEFTNAEIGYQKLLSLIGEEVNVIYNCPPFDKFRLTGNAYPIISGYFPSLFKTCENAYALSLTAAYRWVIYLPSLKVIMVIISSNGYGGNGQEFYSVSDTGVLIKYDVSSEFDVLQYYTPGVNSYTINVLLCDYSSPDDLKDTSKTKLLHIQIPYTNNPTYKFSITITNKNFVLLYSTVFKEPDGKLSTDPFEPGGNSGENDTPPGTFDDTSDPIPDSPLPTLSMADTGFTRIYNPTLSQVQSLAEYMWKTENIFETLWNKVKQSFENPMDVMIAFNIVPVAVPDGGTADFSIMYIPTGVQLTKAANQFVDVDCGTLTLNGYYGSALDYSPNTRIQCFLPFIGMIELNPDEVMNTTLQIKYRVDIVSGGCVAKIFIDNNCLYQYSGHCSISVPFTASDFSSYMNAMLQVSALAVGAIAAGTGAALAAGADAGAEAVAQQTNRTVKHTVQTKTARNPDTGRQITMGTITTHQTIDRPVEQDTTQASYDGLSPQNIFNTASAVMASKAGISHAGSFNGNTGYLGVRYPFLIITTPRQCLPSSFQKMNGYPSMITLPLSECSGYTRVQQVQLTGMTATNPEQAEILQLLKEGVIL